MTSDAFNSGALPPSLENYSYNDPALNAALREAVDFVHAEGWDRPPTLFALVPYQLIADALGPDAANPEAAPLALVVQDDLPDHIQAGSDELGEFIASLRWPEGVVGAILAQEIMFSNSAPDADDTPQPARLFSGVLAPAATTAQATGQRSLLQLRPTEAELDADPFGNEDLPLLGGDDIAPGVIATLLATFDPDADPELPF